MFVDEKAAGEKQPVEVGKLKLSEAIREGARRYPHERHVFFGEGGSRCALAGAAEVLGMAVLPMLQHFGISAPMEINVYRLNREESREAAADWLESQGY